MKLQVKYPKRFPGSKIHSVLPVEVEALVGKGVQVAENVHISSDLKSLGKNVYIGWDTRISQCESIGNFTSISNGVKIGLINHALDHISTSPYFYAKRKGWVEQDTFPEEGGSQVVIGHDVLISAGVIVLKGVKIGTGAVIGAGAIVTKDIPPYAIAVGSPARVVKFRFDEALVERLLRSEWWNLDDEKLKSLKLHFNDPEKLLGAIGC